MDSQTTMTEAAATNAATIKSAYDAFSRGDVKGAMAAFADGIQVDAVLAKGATVVALCTTSARQTEDEF